MNIIDNLKSRLFNHWQMTVFGAVAAGLIAAAQYLELGTVTPKGLALAFAIAAFGALKKNFTTTLKSVGVDPSVLAK